MCSRRVSSSCSTCGTKHHKSWHYWNIPFGSVVVKMKKMLQYNKDDTTTTNNETNGNKPHGSIEQRIKAKHILFFNVFLYPITCTLGHLKRYLNVNWIVFYFFLFVKKYLKNSYISQNPEMLTIDRRYWCFVRYLPVL